jgi:hypothetical protein
MHGRPPTMSGRLEIRLPISVTVAIDSKYTAFIKLGHVCAVSITL